MTTPYDARRAMRLREASEKAYHLAHIVKDYPNHRKDGAEFGQSQLTRIEKVLAETAALIVTLVDDERKHLDADTHTFAPKLVGERPEFVRIPDFRTGTPDEFRTEASDFTVPQPANPEQTIPPSLLERIRNRTDCD